MTAYVYTVRSNKPLQLSVGVGNVPSISAGIYPLVVRDQVVEARSNGASASLGEHVTMELVERIEP